MDNKTKVLLEKTITEIRQLRSVNEIMSVRLDMFDKMMLLFHTSPFCAGMSMSEDICYQIEKHIEAETSKPQ